MPLPSTKAKNQVPSLTNKHLFPKGLMKTKIVATQLYFIVYILETVHHIPSIMIMTHS
jgi:hypothetical protein